MTTVRIFTATKLLQIASHRAVYVPGRAGQAFSGPSHAIAYGPHTGILQVFLLLKARAGPYGSCDKYYGM